MLQTNEIIKIISKDGKIYNRLAQVTKYASKNRPILYACSENYIFEHVAYDLSGFPLFKSIKRKG